MSLQKESHLNCVVSKSFLNLNFYAGYTYMHEVHSVEWLVKVHKKTVFPSRTLLLPSSQR